MNAPALQLLMRQDCHLCEQAAAKLRRLGVDFTAVDVDQDMDLRQAYGEAIPVLLDASGRELARAPLDGATIRRALRQVAAG